MPRLSATRSKMKRGNMRAGGSLVAIGTIAGTIAGGLLGQPSAGLLVGFGLGVVAALIVWAIDRKRHNR